MTSTRIASNRKFATIDAYKSFVQHAKDDVKEVSTMNRLRTWDFRTQASSDRNLRFAFNELHTLKDKLGLHFSYNFITRMKLSD